MRLGNPGSCTASAVEQVCACSRKFLNLGQLALFIDGTLFVHGQAANTSSPAKHRWL